MKKEKRKEMLDALSSTACCPFHDDMCRKAKRYIIKLEKEIKSLNTIIDKYDKELKRKTDQYEYLRHYHNYQQ